MLRNNVTQVLFDTSIINLNNKKIKKVNETIDIYNKIKNLEEVKWMGLPEDDAYELMMEELMNRW